MASNPSRLAQIDPKNGTGDWLNFNLPFDWISEIAAEWNRKLVDIQKPWLCWHVSPRWSILQQRLVQSVGWTPVIGFDPRVGSPPVLPGSILIDFNESFKLPVMWPHFPLEFAFLWTKRLAFWHADLLCRLPVMEYLAKTFESLEDGQMAAVLDKGGRRNYLNFKSHRFWELCGCTTEGASENQFYNGTGWWRNFSLHPKCRLPSERRRRQKFSYDSGVGILYWKNNYNGSVVPISIHSVKEGHCSEIMSRAYKSAPAHQTALRNLPSELDANYDIEAVARRLGISHLL
jgi:hypothetical protein